jgi:UDP-N-acetylmuramate--alanine ligase
MPLLDPTSPRPIHFQGIAGAGMSALAELCHRRGAKVTGCDQNPEGAADLLHLGIKVERGHDPLHLEGHRALVVSSAIPKDHPEVLRARMLGIEVVRRAEALAEATAGGMLIGVAGTHGKSTTTVMVTEALAAAGKNPTGVVGARVTSWGGNLSKGGHDIFVVEADEYDRSFLALQPTVAVVTNVEADHLDIYRDLKDIHDTFSEFVGRARYVVLCADDPGANALPSPATAEVIRYGITSPDARLIAKDVRHRDGRTVFAVEYDGKPMGEVVLGVPGLHNVRNALAAAACAFAAGVPAQAIGAGLSAFRPYTGRLQVKQAPGGATVIDDSYNANPDSVRAAIDVLAGCPGPTALVLGDMGEVGSQGAEFHREVGSYASARKISRLYAIGEATRHAVEAFGAGGRHFESVDELVADIEGKSILVKGSRFMKMERVVAALTGAAQGGH